MSRIGNLPVNIPKGVDVKLADDSVVVKGASGTLTVQVPPMLSVSLTQPANCLSVTRTADGALARSLHGLVRSLISNSVTGVIKPWEVKLEIVGVGYQASVAGKVLTLDVGFANPIRIDIPSTVTCALPDSTHITLTSPDKQLVGQIAANIRSVRKPEPYKGKGIRYSGEIVKRKSGKAFGS